MTPAQRKLVAEAYAAYPDGVFLHRTQWATARALERKVFGWIWGANEFILSPHIKTGIDMGRAMEKAQ